jgi:integrase
VWTNSVGSPTDPSRTRHAFIRTARAAHLDASWTPNSLRHTTASILSDAGAPLEDIADQLGHKDTRMAALHYRHRIQPTIATGLLMADTIATDNPRRTNEHPSTLSTR